MGFFDNPIATMPGREFILLYCLVVAGTLVFAWWLTRFGGGLADDNRPIHLENDPYLAALLRGGAIEVAKLAIAELLRTGAMRLEGAELISAKKNTNLQLSPIAAEAKRWFLGQSMALRDVFRPGHLPSALEPQIAELQRRLEGAGLLANEALLVFRRRVTRALTFAVVGLGCFKLFVALYSGRYNVGYLIGASILFLIGMAILRSTAPRYTPKGRRYLKDLQFTFADFRTRLASEPDADRDPRFLLAVALFGLPVLAGTAYSAYADEMQRQRMAEASSSSSCTSGSSCSSSSDGGSSDGGSSDGGSSCGGGGCGGCGGGGGD